ncbi:MAG: hypothetical protein ACE5IB_01285 [Candidatus Geothermarchaeales archaeon]
MDGEIVLQDRFLLLGQGYLWVGVGDTEADFGIQYGPSLWL